MTVIDTTCRVGVSCRRRPSAATAALGGVTAACNVIGGGAATTGTFNWMTWGDHYIDPARRRSKRPTRSRPRTSASSPATPRASPSSRRSRASSTRCRATPCGCPTPTPRMGSSSRSTSTSSRSPRSCTRSRRSSRHLDDPRATWLSLRLVADQHLLQPEVSVRPDSTGQVLLDPKYKGRVVVENQPEEIVAYMARAAAASTSRTT